MSLARAVRFSLLQIYVSGCRLQEHNPFCAFFFIHTARYNNRQDIEFPISGLWKGETLIAVTKQDLIAFCYGTSFAADIIRQTKKLMIEKGPTYDQSRKLDRVPREAVEELLGIRLSDHTDD